VADVAGRTNNMLSLGLVFGELFGKEDDDENRRTSPGFYRKGRVSHAQPWYAWPRNGNGRVGSRSFEMIVVSRRMFYLISHQFHSAAADQHRP
jgi:hypothetical protein